jgi:hypothetical protein
LQRADSQNERGTKPLTLRDQATVYVKLAGKYRACAASRRRGGSGEFTTPLEDTSVAASYEMTAAALTRRAGDPVACRSAVARGLHDYATVATDTSPFSRWLTGAGAKEAAQNAFRRFRTHAGFLRC